MSAHMNPFQNIAMDVILGGTAFFVFVMCYLLAAGIASCVVDFFCKRFDARVLRVVALKKTTWADSEDIE